MFNILLAIRVWANSWNLFLFISIQCDNKAVVDVLNKGKTKNMDLAAISRNIFMTCAKNDIELKVSHVLGKNKPIADLLSRWSQVSFPIKKLHQLMPKFQEMKVNNSLFYVDYTI